MDDLELEIGAVEVESVTLPERPPRWELLGPRRLGADEGQVAVCLFESALLAIHAHAASSLHEIGGLLVGDAFSWRGRIYAQIEAALPGETPRAGPAHVTFTAETWAGVLRRQERELPGRTIVGWYHSHPRMGIYLSEMDLAIQRSFFPQPWHIALVINGQDENVGLFAWNGMGVLPLQRFAWRASHPVEPGIALRPGTHPFSYTLCEPAEREKPRWRYALPLIALTLVGSWLLARWLFHKDIYSPEENAP